MLNLCAGNSEINIQTRGQGSVRGTTPLVGPHLAAYTSCLASVLTAYG